MGTFERTGLTCNVRLEAEPLRPAQEPHPPLIIGGGGGPRNARLAATYADEFNTPFVPLEGMKKAYASVRAACETLGRDPGDLVWSVALTLCCGRNEAELAKRAAAIGMQVDDLRRDALAGLPAEILEKLGKFADAGAERFYLQVLDLSDLDHLRLVAEEILPHAPGRNS